jgi:succinyl-CoA synthetase alpha subunit
MAFKSGHQAKVTLGANTVVGMGNWELPGISVDLLESTSFGDSAKQFMLGLLDYGNVNFGGLYDPADTTGQDILISANRNSSKIGNVRLYVDNTSYWTPNVTVVSAAGMLVQTVAIGIDKAGLGTIKFTGKCTGPWVLV